MSPIYRNPLDRKLKFELVRLDDRIAPGSVWASAAAGAVGLAGPLAWVGLNEPELTAVGPTFNAVPPEANNGSIDADQSDARPGYFSLTVPGSISPDDSTSVRTENINDDSPAFGGLGMPDLGEPEAETPNDPMSAVRNNFTPPIGGGGSSGVGIPETNTGLHSGGFAVSGGLPAHPPADTTSPLSPSPVRGGGGGRGSGITAPAPQPVPAAASPAANPMPKPAGHFAAQLQALLHSNDSGGAFSLTDTANQQSQIGALVGGQLSNAAGFGSANAAAHRPASLLGQALADGSNKNLGLRTSKSSSGAFGLVGSQSIGDLMTRHTPDGSGLTAGEGAISKAIPVNGSPTLPGPRAGAPQPTAPDTGEPGTGWIVLAAPSSKPPAGSGNGDGEDGGNMTPMLTPSGGPDVTFTLTIPVWGNEAFVETGSFSFPSGWQPGASYLNVDVHAWISADGTPSGDDRGEGWWGEYAYPAAGAMSFDLSQVQLFAANLDAFNDYYFYEFVNNADPGYALTMTGASPPADTPDTSATTSQSGTVTTHVQNNFLTTGTDTFNITVQGPANGARVVTRDDTIDASFGGSDTGSDTDSANPATTAVTNDTFNNAVSNGTSTETDHIEGTTDADGTFHLTHFSIDSTDDYDFSDSIGGSESQPEPGGNESDTFNDSDSGHDHDHLHAEGTPDNWTASFDDTDSAAFNDGDNGGESSSQSTNGTTDTNHDTFHADDGGTHTDVLHLAGSGDATSFTASAVSDRIEDTYNFHDSDGGSAGETSDGESDSDGYGATNNGDADEVLTIAGNATSLTAGYTDLVHDGFTDSDDINDGWSGGGDSCADHSTDGDDGHETANLSASATLANWQADSTTSPTWQITTVSADVTGSADVHSGDDGTDTDTNAANSADSEVEHFVDTSTGTDGFAIHLTGDGTVATLTPTSTYVLGTHSEDDTTDRFDDPTTLDGQNATDNGSDTIDDTEDSTGTVAVTQHESIDATGQITPGASTVDVTDTDTVGLIDDGSDSINGVTGTTTTVTSTQNAATSNDTLVTGLDSASDSFHDTAQVGEGVHIHADTTAGGTTTVAVDQSIGSPDPTQPTLGGAVSMTGQEYAIDTLNVNDETTDAATGTIGGRITGHLHSAGTVAGNVLTPTGSNGDFGVNVTGSCSDVQKTIVNTTAPTADQIVDGLFRVDDAGTIFMENNGPVRDPAADPRWPVMPQRTISAQITTTHTIAYPSYSLAETDADANGAWSEGKLADATDRVETTTTAGVYQNCMFLLGYSGSGSMTDKTEVATTENNADGAGVSGTQTTTHTFTMNAIGSFASGADITGGAANANANLTDTDVVTGAESLGGAATAGLTETRNATGGGYQHLELDWAHNGPDGSGNGEYDTTYTSTRDYHQSDDLAGSVRTLDGASGTDKIVARMHFLTAIPNYQVEYTENQANTETHSKASDTRIDEETGQTDYWIENVTGVTPPYDSSTYVAPQYDPRDWLDKASDFSAGMADAVSCGLTQRIRSAGGFDDMVDKNSGFYKGGQVTGTIVSIATAAANPCGAAAGMKLAIQGLSAVQGTGQLLNAADAARNGDPLGFALNVVGARMSFSKLGTNCFAYEVPVGLEFGRKAAGEIRQGDNLLAVDEHDPDGKATARRVVGTFARVAPIWELYVGKRIVRTTQEHPFFVRGKGWTPLAEIKAGDELRTGEGGWIHCDGVEDTKRPETVYNFEVEGDHTYFVGDPVTWGFSLWAHNYNRWGRRGSPAHRQGIADAEAALQKQGYKTLTGGAKGAEKAVNVPGGGMRYPDITMTNGTQTVAVQVGRVNAAGRAVKRELDALTDLRASGAFGQVIFQPFFP